MAVLRHLRRKIAGYFNERYKSCHKVPISTFSGDNDRRTRIIFMTFYVLFRGFTFSQSYRNGFYILAFTDKLPHTVFASFVPRWTSVYSPCFLFFLSKIFMPPSGLYMFQPSRIDHYITFWDIINIVFITISVDFSLKIG